MGMAGEEFREKFRGSPAKRAKWRGLIRNVAAALSNSDDPRAEAVLVDALNHPQDLVRHQAALSPAATRSRPAAQRIDHSPNIK
jgi:epoxyqueuosine reductase QueG